MFINIIKRFPKAGNGWFSEELDNYLNSKAAANTSYERKRVIRPSEIGQCARKIVRILLHQVKEPPVEAKQQRIFDMGNAVHKRYLNTYIPAIGCVALIDGKPFIEHPIEDAALWVKGAPDAVIINRKDNMSYIFELKSVKHEIFQDLTAPSEDYLDQVHLYMHILDIPRAIIFYENKNTSEILEFSVNFDSNRWNKILNKIHLIQKYVLEYENVGALPERCRNKYCIGCKD